MQKVAIVILANSDNSESLGRVVNGLMAAQEFSEGGDCNASSRKEEAGAGHLFRWVCGKIFRPQIERE
jgi:hypothetical protein